MLSKTSFFQKSFWSFLTAAIIYSFLPGPTYAGFFLFLYVILLYKYIYGNLSLAFFHLYLFTLVVGNPAFTLEGVVVQDFTFFNYPVLLSIPMYISWRFIVFMLLALLVLGNIYRKYQAVKDRNIRILFFLSWISVILVSVGQFFGNFTTKYKFPFFQLVQILLVFPVLFLLFFKNKQINTKATWIFYGFCIFSLMIEGIIATAQFLLKAPLGIRLETTFNIPFVTAPETGLFRSPGTLGHPNYLGVFTGMLLPIAVLILLNIRQGFERKLIKTSVVFGFLGLLLSLSRWAWINGFIAVFLIILVRKNRLPYFIKNYGNFIPKKNILKTISVLLISVSVLTFVVNRFLMFKTFEGRLEVFRSAIIIIKEHPFWGVGPGNTTVDLSPYRWSIAEYLNSLKGVHNSILLMATESGIPLAILISLFFALIIYEMVIYRKIIIRFHLLGFALSLIVFMLNSAAYSLLYWDPSLELYFVISAFFVFGLNNNTDSLN